MIYQTKILIMLVLYISVFIISYSLGKKLGNIRNRAYFDSWFYKGVFDERDRVEGKEKYGK